VGEPDGRLCFVDVLSSSARGTHYFDFDLLLVDIGEVVHLRVLVDGKYLRRVDVSR
jgi:hypothetical protein